MFRAHRQAALVCLAVALLSQLLLPGMHAAVHALERAHDGARHDGSRQTHSGGRAVVGEHSHGGGEHSHGGASLRHERSMRSAGAGKHGHSHHGERPGDRHGAGSLEHFAACYLEATPPALALPFRRVEPTVVPLVAGRLFTSPVPRAHAVRGPPEQRGA